MGRWDSFAKLLIGSRPQQYVSWLIAGAELVEVLNVELNAQHKNLNLCYNKIEFYRSA